MTSAVYRIFREKNIRSHLNEGILIANVTNTREGLCLAKEILSTAVDKKTALYLSGGRTPKELYESLATEDGLHPGSVGLVDERFGPKLHESSNEKMLKDTGLLRFLDYNDIPFYPILTITPHLHPLPQGERKAETFSPSPLTGEGGGEGEERKEAAQMYDEKLRSLLSVFQNHISVLGIGLDGHTAGIAGNRQDFTNPLFDPSRKNLLVSEFNDELGMFKERITMTFLGLSMMDLLIVLVFGEDKQKALELMFKDGPEEEIPARFLKRPGVALKTLLITDQNV